jgi:hypothetical protein
MEDELGQGLKIKSQRRVNWQGWKVYSHKNPVSEDEGDLFFDAEGGSNNFQEKVNINNSNKVQHSSGFVTQFNRLNKDFNERINVLDEVASKVVVDVDRQSDEEVETNRLVLERMTYNFHVIIYFRLILVLVKIFL